MKEDGLLNECIICGRPNSHNHHVVFKSECKPLEHCQKNQVRLCYEHHQGTCGVHGKYGDELNIRLKLEFQEWLEEVFTKDKYSISEIQKKLGISQNTCRSLSKLLPIARGGMYLTEDIIRICMGGMIYE